MIFEPVSLNISQVSCERDDRLLFHNLSFALSSGDILRVAGPIRNTRLRLSQNVDTNPEAGEEKPEAGVENDPANVQALAESVASLDKRVDDLYMTLKLLVDRLGAEE